MLKANLLIQRKEAINDIALSTDFEYQTKSMSSLNFLFIFTYR